MSVQVVTQTPLADALHQALLPKLVEVGWGSGGDDDAALSEYIILMLVNGKTQDQIAAELAGDLLNLGPDDPGARDFSRWLFEQVETLNQQLNSGAKEEENGSNGDAMQEVEMENTSEVSDVAVPTGPKSMRNGSTANRTRDKRMLGHMSKAMDRSKDDVLHRVRPHSGNERINSHARVPPTGPRGSLGLGRGGAGPRIQPGRGAITPQVRATYPMAVPAQREMQFMQLFEQQAAMLMQQMANGMNGGNGYNGNFFNPQQSTGRPLHERVQPNPRGGQQNGGFRKQSMQNTTHSQAQEPAKQESSMDLDMPLSDPKPLGPDTICKFNLSCTNKDCKFAHQSPAAPPGAPIDVNDVCSYGAACKNKKCVGRHPSPAQKIAHQVEQDCRFWPNCTNQRCPFRHATLCRNGADCSEPDCKFTHVKTMCKFNPCLNPACAFKHAEGQKRGKYEDKVWVAGEKQHISERKFVDENSGEELIKPEPESEAGNNSSDSIKSDGIIT